MQGGRRPSGDDPLRPWPFSTIDYPVGCRPSTPKPRRSPARPRFFPPPTIPSDSTLFHHRLRASQARRAAAPGAGSNSDERAPAWVGMVTGGDEALVSPVPLARGTGETQLGGTSRGARVEDTN